ncbi:TetR/AcrR family transcriptional regulator [Paenibacillus sp. GCM10012307]|uniref:TetR/AcrR family transcriptional regulator n=1 Tax=Paenibacillus roseus TaxID=2798579 RepID=A0A934IWU0_9BACL|nr:TetR/AcrR family transcriptional regulator [Paenibacillus roseus]MBJ6360752.1 TetR/AcrR family transcriptional regulator [Paenibacillus roseus]
MTLNSRERMIEGAVKLLGERGAHAASLNEIMKATGAPRGSIYHHFPQGKEQIIGEALELAGNHALNFLNNLEGEPAETVAGQFISLWRMLLSQSNFEMGCSVLAVTIGAESSDLLDRAASVFRQWVERLTALLAAGGVGSDSARGLANVIISSCEGAVAISKAQKSFDTFNIVAEQLLVMVRNASATQSQMM